MQKVNIITLGCSKNLVDSEFLLRQFEANGYKIEFDSNATDASVVIINTCGFILDAKEESIETILQYCEAKNEGNIENLFVIGCLSERYRDELKAEMPEVDEFYGKFDFYDILKNLNEKYYSEYNFQRFLTTPKHFAYLKISEGCDRHCSFCAIPAMTGKHKSKSIESLIKESQYLTDKGVKELLLIAQDLSYYGIDTYKKTALPQLIETLLEKSNIDWIRLHYLYPTKFPLDILPLMRNNDRVCNYLDLPLQHISNNVLKLMRRNTSQSETIKLIEQIRQSVPGIGLRTTMLVGHPGETDKDFEELVGFVKDARFDRLGVFAYSHEEGTYAGKNYNDDIPDDIKQERKDTIMEIQQQISREINESKIGKTLKVIIDRKENEYFIGRTEFDSPEVDGEVLIDTRENNLKIGEFYDIEINAADDYDLYGRIR